MVKKRLTVLGSNAAYPTNSHGCSGFLLEWADFRLVLDLGYGCLDRLLQHCPDAGLNAVVVTHQHPDHFIDLHGLLRLYFYGNAPPRKKTPLFCPLGVLQVLRQIEPGLDPEEVFDFHELSHGCEYRLGPLHLTGLLLPHFVPNIGVRLCCSSSGEPDVVVAYTGDTGPTERLAELGADATLFVVEATDRPGEVDKTSRNLMTAKEAGLWAATARARCLLLTHFWPGNDREKAREAALSEFPGKVLVAKEDLRVDLDDLVRKSDSSGSSATS